MTQRRQDHLQPDHQSRQQGGQWAVPVCPVCQLPSTRQRRRHRHRLDGLSLSDFPLCLKTFLSSVNFPFFYSPHLNVTGRKVLIAFLITEDIIVKLAGLFFSLHLKTFNFLQEVQLTQ